MKMKLIAATLAKVTLSGSSRRKRWRSKSFRVI